MEDIKIQTELQKAILNKLMFSLGLKYSELHEVTDNHDLFNYHLRYLHEKGYIEKKDNLYILTAEGRKYVGFMEEDGKIQEKFKVGMFIDIVRKVNNKTELLLFKKLKHPHYGYIGTVSGKLKWGENIETNLKRELKEELNIEPLKWDIIGVVKEIMLNEKYEKVCDAVFFIVTVTEFVGEPELKGIEGEYFWYDIDEILKLDKIFKKGFEKGLPPLKEYLKNHDEYKPYIIENVSDPLVY